MTHCHSSPLGLGHTLAEYNWGINQAMEYNLTRVYTPLTCPNKAQLSCNDFFGVGINENFTLKLIDWNIKEGYLKKVVIDEPDQEKLKEVVMAHPENDVVFAVAKKCPENDYSRSRTWWREKMRLARETPVWAQNPSSVKYDPASINVALHLRRGDIMRKPGLVKQRFTGNEFYINTLQTLQSLFPNNQVVGHFFSQGNRLEFADIEGRFPGHPIILTGTPLGDFRGMMESDILVTAKSGFSHLAAVMSDVMAVAIPFWASYDYLPSVIMADVNSTLGFDPAEFVRVWNIRTPEQRKGALAVLG